MSSRLSVTAALTLCAVLPLTAHHSHGNYDLTTWTAMDGTVKELHLLVPHSWIYLDVKNTDGSVTNWMVEAGAPNALLRRGWTKASLLPGTEILVEGYQAKDGANRANGRDITFKDGKKLFVGSAGTGAPGDDQPGKSQ